MKNAQKKPNFVVVDRHFLNFSHDMAMGRNVANYTPPPNVQMMERDLAPLADLLPEADISYSEDASVWGWDLSYVNRMRAAGYSNLPTAAQLADIRRLASRHTAVEMLPAIRRRLPQNLTAGESCFVSEKSAGVFEQASRGGSSAVGEAGADIVGKFVRGMEMANYKWAILKAPYSGSGRGLRMAESSQLTAPDTMPISLRHWLMRCLREQGGVVIEPYYNKVADFALEFKVTPSEVEYLGLSVFETNANNVYSFNLIASQPALWQRVKRLVPSLDSGQLIGAVREELHDRFVGHYLGPVGVDMMVIDDSRIPLLHPCVEVNVRRTMGELSLHLLPLLAEGVEGRFRLLYNKENAGLRREISAMPSARYDERGCLVSGTHLLTPVNADTRYAALIEA